MKRVIMIILLMGFIWLYFPAYTLDNGETDRDLPYSNPVNLTIHGEAGLLMDERTGKILYAKNENEHLYPASLTKILTALIALEKGNLNDRVKVGNEVLLRTNNESSAGLRKNDVISLRVLLRAMLLRSGNDAARTVAVYIAKKDSGKLDMDPNEGIQYFAHLMNVKAKELGAVHSHFVNPHGLHDANHYTTAKDIALIARAARQNPEFREIVSEEAYRDSSYTFYNRNQLINRNSDTFFQGADGIKTGFTDQAGHCLVSSAKRDERILIAVVLHSSKAAVYKDSTVLLNYGFENEYASK